ncbi:MAG: Lrp/AsnC family transcriptional regulator [Hyphomonadaceae bacterium]
MTKKLSPAAIDAKDRVLLGIVQLDGRITNADLAARVGLSPAACHKRLKRLETSGVIRQYAALIDPDVGGRSQSAFVHIALDRQNSDGFEAFERAVLACPQIIECHLMTGEYDYLLHILFRDAEEYEHLHRSVLSRLPNVTRINSGFAIRRVRRSTAIPLEV